MSGVRLCHNKLMVDQQPLPLLSGEVHYWRLDPANWPAVLDAVKAMGLEMIATYVPWQHHQLADGGFDFDGATRPTRNLTGFLDLAARKGLWVVLRPGPYIYSEWVNSGVIDEVIGYHRLHPRFLEPAQRYIRALGETMRPYLATSGGRIVAVQLDNQIETWDALYPDQMGLDGGDDLFQQFLRERYGTPERLNAVWGTDFGTFSDVGAYTADPIGTPTYKLRHLDSVRFRHWYVRRYATWLRETYRAAGFDVPLYCNTYDTLQDQKPSDLAAVADFIGLDSYPWNEFSRSPDEHREYMENIRYSGCVSPVCYISEFECGLAHGFMYWGHLRPHHYRMATLSAMMAGAKGWNWYMLVNRDNWLGSPINEWGRRREELAGIFEELIAVFTSTDWPAARKLTNTAVCYHPLHQVAGGTEFSAAALPHGGVDFHAAPLKALYDAGIEYEFLDLEIGETRQPMLIYSGTPWLPLDAQQRLVDYVESGGNLAFFQNWPRLDETLRPLNALGIREPHRILSKGLLDNFDFDLSVDLGPQGAGVVVPKSFMTFKNVPGQPILARRTRFSHYETEGSAEEHNRMREMLWQGELTVGYVERRGKGQMIVLGVTPNESLVDALHQHLNVPLPVRSLTQGIHPALFDCRGRKVLLVVNNGQEPKAGVLRFDRAALPPGPVTVRRLGVEAAWRTVVDENGLLAVSLPRKDGMALEIIPD